MAEMRILMAHIRQIRSNAQIETYENNGGYQAIRKAIPQIAPVRHSRDGQAIRLTRSWRGRFSYRNEMGIYSERSHSPKYLVCNCDESEPGTFKDRLAH